MNQVRLQPSFFHFQILHTGCWDWSISLQKLQILKRFTAYVFCLVWQLKLVKSIIISRTLGHHCSDWWISTPIFNTTEKEIFCNTTAFFSPKLQIYLEFFSIPCRKIIGIPLLKKFLWVMMGCTFAHLMTFQQALQLKTF